MRTTSNTFRNVFNDPLCRYYGLNRLRQNDPAAKFIMECLWYLWGQYEDYTRRCEADDIALGVAIMAERVKFGHQEVSDAKLVAETARWLCKLYRVRMGYWFFFSYTAPRREYDEYKRIMWRWVSVARELANK
ncbi:hypothetical protein A2368_02020 [Candidatus Collierbacteria bacterium RIFOXYB1_FULL_49_13]|uniref:Uncharacterized protein n=1 Tax=Candidatus Collierbacteria bacterium RIFOXYB1_FULL_49_13 TaxID=1817728 RepID=A0A1F5FG69_9BACT|nr:MAG: hypothetical protein A2368_02020 [Candidatus Collierbacteria bacterium RIFOXYB1_FULL_49_13]